ncbi:MAG: Wzz/FepE/Etk N-terminal domain-containing protein [Methylococcales bacterium]|nr:lipopolysaccharide biosynthesis protein [Methylococcaceae bacterium]
MENQTLDIKDYLNILKRRINYLLIPAAVIAVLSILLAVLLPPVYKSTSTILIEEQEIPPELVKSTVTTFADQRIQMISQRIMTRSNLMEIIGKFDLYADDRKNKTQEVILEKMRSSIKVETINADVIDPRNGQPTKATIAFTLSFDYASAAVAQKVANELTTLFLNENIKNRTESAESTTLFLSEEARRLKDKIQQIQTELAAFKEKNLDQLPQISQLNQQELTSLSNQLISLDSQERSLQERRFYLEGQLAQIDPNAMAMGSDGARVMDMKDRLKLLKSQYPSAQASYSAAHPDVIKIKREIESLEKEIGTNSNINDLNAELTKKKADLAGLKKQYSDKHPDVLKLQKQIEILQQTMVQAKNSDSIKSGVEADNPAYITLKTQLESLLADFKSLDYIRNQTKSKIASLRESLRQAPLVEKEYMDLIQDLDNTNLRYREVSAREMEAQISQQLEMEHKGERFALIDPALEPEKPVSPNRVAILFLGFVFAVAAGVGSIAVVEMLDSSIYSEKALISILGQSPLAVIPYLESKDEFETRKRKQTLFLFSLAGAFVIAVVGFNFIVMPLDVFWYKLLRLLGFN